MKWKILAVLVIVPILVLWFMVVHQKDEILALARSEVVTDAAGQRTWSGSFVNTLGSFDSLVGVGREERDKFTAEKASKSKTNSLILN